jgi:hypothetical protein
MNAHASTHTSKIPVNPLLEELNRTYMEAHFEKEDAFWKDKMALAARVPGDFEKKEIRLQTWISDPKYLPALRAELAKPDLTPEDRIGLQGWLRFFDVHAIENPEAKALANRIVEMEARLQEARQAMKLGYSDPASGSACSCAPRRTKPCARPPIGACSPSNAKCSTRASWRSCASATSSAACSATRTITTTR